MAAQNKQRNCVVLRADSLLRLNHQSESRREMEAWKNDHELTGSHRFRIMLKIMNFVELAEILINRSVSEVIREGEQVFEDL